MNERRRRKKSCNMSVCLKKRRMKRKPKKKKTRMEGANFDERAFRFSLFDVCCRCNRVRFSFLLNSLFSSFDQSKVKTILKIDCGEKRMHWLHNRRIRIGMEIFFQENRNAYEFKIDLSFLSPLVPIFSQMALVLCKWLWIVIVAFNVQKKHGFSLMR